MIKDNDTILEDLVKIFTLISLFIVFPVIIARYGILAHNSNFTIMTDVIWYYGALLTFKLIK